MVMGINLVTEGGGVKGSLYSWVKTSVSNSAETIPTNYGDLSCNCVESIMNVCHFKLWRKKVNYIFYIVDMNRSL